MTNPALYNPHLDGGPFVWDGGPVGVALSHGYTATTAEVRLLAEGLHRRGYAVAAPLLAGHGTHPADLNRVTWRDWVDDVEEAYASLSARCDRVFLGGQSMGGLLALYLAGLHPEAAGVLLYAPAIRLTLSARDKIGLYLGSLFLTEVGRASMDGSDRWQGYPGLPLKGAIQLLRLQAVTRKRLSRVSQPVLVFQGRKDTTVHPSAGEIILRGVSSRVKEHHWMEQSSHAIPLDSEVAVVTDLTVRFIESTRAG